MLWIAKHPKAHPDMLGYIPTMIHDTDPRPAREQFDEAYGHGGGWNSFQGFTMLQNGNLLYPDDPPVQLLFETVLHASTPRRETIRFYDFAWVAIVQEDGSFDISRMD
jgi:hypothetical protein